MKVAIIGSGPSGMACAHELERHGIYPDMYEKRPRPGDPFDHCAAVLQVFTRPYDPLKHLREKFFIDIKPVAEIKAITMKSPNRKTTVRGSLGYFFIRGQHSMSVESQLWRGMKSPLIASTSAEYTDLSRKYDYVVVANGSYNVSRTEGIWSVVLQTKLVGGIVLGSFNTQELVMWLDTRYSKSSYAYLAPLDPKRAFLGLVTTYCPVDESRKLWRLFWDIERLPYTQVNEIVIEHNAGFVYPHQVGNLLFVGIAGGFQEPFLGFGLVAALKSGVLAGRAIATGQRYEDLIGQLKEDMQHSLVFRRLLNNAGNRDYDLILRALGLPGVKQVIYNTNIDFVRIGSAAISHFKGLMERLRKW